MKAQDLKVNQIYEQVTDKKIPLMFLKKEKIEHCMETCYKCYFSPVKTEVNKN